MISPRIFSLAVVMFLLPSCSIVYSEAADTEKIDVLLLNYSDFGPPQLAEEILGRYQWQWGAPENHKPQTYDIKVVVYHESNSDSVKKLYPLNEKNKKDYRYLSYSEATVWLKQKIDFFEADIASGDENNFALMYPFLRQFYLTLISVEESF